MPTLNDRFCSHCFKKTNHTKVIQNYLTRNVYICDNCHNFTLTCRSLSCDHMAQGSLSPENKKIIQQQLIEDGSDSNAICSSRFIYKVNEHVTIFSNIASCYHIW